MGKFKFLALSALAALMLPACSSDPIAEGPENPNGEDNASFVEAYLNVNINLPQRNEGSRAENDNYADGLAAEYLVKNASIALFTAAPGVDENQATFVGAYVIFTGADTDPASPATGNNCTKHIDGQVKLLKGMNYPANNNVYAIAFVNSPASEIIINSDATNPNYGSIKFGTLGTEYTIPTSGTSGLTFGAFRNNICNNLENWTSETNGFFMTNAVLSKTNGTVDNRGGVAFCLVDVTGNIKKTAAEAEANRADIFVERGVAKVTIASANINDKGQIQILDENGHAATSIDATITRWALAHTANQSFLVRNWRSQHNAWFALHNDRATDTSNKWRFAGKTVFTDAALYRTYFGLSARTAPLEVNTSAQVTAALKTNVGSNFPQYCFENTIGVNNMKTDSTTLVVLEVEFKATTAANLYTINGNVTNFYTENAVKVKYADYFKANFPYNTTPGNDAVTVEIDKDATTNVVSVTKITYRKVDETIDTNITTGAILDQVNAAYSIKQYTGGKAYYTVLIKHFGDELTPWPDTEGTTTQQVYGHDATYDILSTTDNANHNYLGRYSVLRNNWYEISATAVKAIGTAVPDIPEDIPDDQVKPYLATKIHVLSWALRTQNVELD